MENEKKRKKILFIIADASSGHRSGAEAVERAIAEEYPGKAAGADYTGAGEYETKTIDIFKIMDIAPFSSVNETQELVSSNRWAEKGQDALFMISTAISPIFEIYYRYMMWRILPAAQEILDDEEPDIVVSVHPFASMLLRGLKEDFRKKHGDLQNFPYKTATMVTDLVTLYRGWGDPEADLIVAPTASAANLLVRFGSNYDNIFYPYFPIKPELKNYRKRPEVMRELGFSDRKHTVMIMGGGFGLRSMQKAIQGLVKDVNMQLIVITGRAEFLREQLSVRFQNLPRVKVFGFVDNIQDYINAADVIVTKPGPASILEVELFNKKVVLTRKIGHQESGNIDYSLKNPHFRYIGNEVHKLIPTINELLKEQAENTHNRRSFDEASQIARKLVGLIQ